MAHDTPVIHKLREVIARYTALHMKRGLYVSGLTLSLVVFGGFALLAAWADITHGHLNSKGSLILIANAMSVG